MYCRLRFFLPMVAGLAVYGEDALNGPQVDAVEQFRKVIAESEEQRRQKH